MNKNNNIFTYATGELSQDAFLCWLFSYAMKDSDNEPVLKECATDFLKQFIPDLKYQKNVWLSEPPKKQYKSIDVLLTVNDKYKVIIEDKTFTSEHNDQLKRYCKTIAEDFNEYIPVGIYFKIGFQSDLSNVRENNYLPFGRIQILSTLEKYITQTNNIIFLSYYENIKTLDEEAQKYKSLPICDWNWAEINGFYEELKIEIENERKLFCNYGYVANASGGFYGMWISHDIVRSYNDKDYELYLQCEYSNGNMNICYKASSKDGDKIYREVREFFVWRENDKWVNIANKHGFEKPQRYGCGKTVTLGFFKKNKEYVDYKQLKKAIYDAIDAFENILRDLDL